MIMLKMDSLMLNNILCLLFCSLFLVGCESTDNSDKEQQSCFYLHEDKICLNIAEGYKLTRHNKYYKEGNDHIRLQYKLKGDSISVLIRRTNNIIWEPPNTNIIYLNWFGIESEFTDYLNDIPMSKIVEYYYSIPTVTDEYYLQTDLMTVNFAMYCFYKKVLYINNEFMYRVNVKYNTITRLEEDNVNLLLDNFYLESLNNIEVYRQKVLHMD